MVLKRRKERKKPPFGGREVVEGDIFKPIRRCTAEKEKA